MRSPGVGIRLHCTLHVRFRIREFLLSHQRFAQRKQRANMLGIEFQRFCPMGLRFFLIFHLEVINAEKIIHRRVIRSQAISRIQMAPRFRWLVGAQRLQRLA